MATSDYSNANPLRYEMPARAVRVAVREFPSGPLSPLSMPQTYYREPRPIRVDVPGQPADESELETIASSGWRIESHTTSWDELRGRLWQAIVVTTDGRRYYADIDRRD